MINRKLQKIIPNAITIFRMVLVIILIIIGSYIFISFNNGDVIFTFNSLNENPQMISWVSFFVIFTLATITDFLDGYLARKWNVVSWFGKVMDPIADKMLVLTSLIFLSTVQVVFFWLTALLLLREISISSIRLASSKSKNIVAAQWHGKVKTVLQFLGVIFAGFFYPILKDGSVFEGLEQYFMLMCSSIIMLSLVISYYSLFEYVRQLRKSRN